MYTFFLSKPIFIQHNRQQKLSKYPIKMFVPIDNCAVLPLPTDEERNSSSPLTWTNSTNDKVLLPLNNNNKNIMKTAIQLEDSNMKNDHGW